MNIINIKKQYGVFDWRHYILNNKDLTYLRSNKEAYCHFIENGIKESRFFYFNNDNDNNIIKLNKLNVSYDDFDWITYLRINKDIYLSGVNTKIKSWEHWNKYGIKEERAFSYINNSNIHNGRFGNLFFINMFLHFYSKKVDLLCNYKYFDKFSELGIELNIGTKIYDINLLVTEINFVLLFSKINDKNNTNIIRPSNIIIHNDIWFQNKEFCSYLQDYFNNQIYKNKIIQKNFFKERYNNNNDLFIHLRLGDVESNTIKLFEYYDNLLSSMYFENGYISSDSIKSKFCAYFIKKYNLNIINYDEIQTIMFGSTCNNIILSGGTFSWLIGFFAFYSENIYYPLYEKPWFGNIFETNPKWICINP